LADKRLEANHRDDLDAPFLFVAHGDPPPTEWMARHPGWIQVPATMVPRGSQTRSPAPSPRTIQATGLGVTASAAAIPGALAGLGEAGAGGLAELLGAGVIAPLAALGILLRPSRISPQETDDLLMFAPPSPGTGVSEGESLVPPLPTPIPPGLVPPLESKTSPGEGGFKPSQARPRRRCRALPRHRLNPTCSEADRRTSKVQPFSIRTVTRGWKVEHGQVQGGHERLPEPPIQP
jgi:hypothetical protein